MTTTTTDPETAAIIAALEILASAKVEADITTDSERWGTFPPSLEQIQADPEAKWGFRKFD